MQVAVIGKGIAGLLLGDQLLARGCAVTFFYREESTASAAALGVFVSKGLFLAQDPLFSHKLSAHLAFGSLISQLSERMGEKIPRFQGAQEFFDSPAAYRGLRQRIYRKQFTGALDVEVQRQSAGAGAFYYPQDYWVDAGFSLGVMESDLRRRGAVFIPREVVRVGSAKEGLWVQTAVGRDLFSEVVLAAGEGASALLRESGIAGFPVQRRPGCTARYQLEGPEEAPVFLLKKGRLSLVSHGGIFYMGPFDEEPSPEEEAVLFQYAQKCCPALLPFSLTGRVCSHGTRVRTPHGAPYVGPVSLSFGRRLWVSFGYDKSGFVLAHEAARHIVDRLCGQGGDDGQNRHLQVDWV